MSLIIVAIVLAVLVMCSLFLFPAIYAGGSKLSKGEYADRIIQIYSQEEREADKSKENAFMYSFAEIDGAPFVMICPGGGYVSLSTKSEGALIAKEFNKLGYNAFVLNYRLGENAHYPNPQDDLAAALRYVFANSEALKVDTDGYAITGFSAGGHLTASFGLTDVGYQAYGLPKPATLILAYPVISMNDPTHKGSREALLGEKSDDTAIRDKYSVEKNIDNGYPSTYVWWCKDDLIVPTDASEKFVDELKEKGIHVGSKVYSVGGHGSGLGNTGVMRGWVTLAADFWKAER